MKKITLLLLSTATMFFTACGEDAKKAASNATSAITDTVKEHTSDAVDATKKAAAEAAEAAKQQAAEVAEAAKQKAAEAAEAAKQKALAATEAAKQKATDAAEALKERAAATTAAASNAVATATTTAAATEPKTETKTAENAAGKAAYAKCAGCHGADGKTKALGKSAIIAGQPVADLEASISGYKAGTRNVAGMGTLMKGQVSSMSDDDIKAVAEYISGL